MTKNILMVLAILIGLGTIGLGGGMIVIPMMITGFLIGLLSPPKQHTRE